MKRNTKKLFFASTLVLLIIISTTFVFGAIQIIDTETGRTSFGATVWDAIRAFFSDGITGRAVDEPVMPEEYQFQLDKVGTNFEFSGWKDIAITTSSGVHLVLSVPKNMVEYEIEASNGATSTTLTIFGLDPSTTYYMYEDNYHNLKPFTTDSTGSYTYTQDLTEKHFVFIQTRTSTIFIKGEGVVGDGCVSPVGHWVDNTCVLDQDVYQTIEIDGDGVKLNCDNRFITGPDTGHGIYLPAGITGVTVMNCNVDGFSDAIHFEDGSYNTITGNKVTTMCGMGIMATGSNVAITNNIAKDLEYGYSGMYCGWGIGLTGSSGTITGNTINEYAAGMVITGSDNTIAHNIVENNGMLGFRIRGSYNTIEYNKANYDNLVGILIGGFGNTLTGNEANYNTLILPHAPGRVTGMGIGLAGSGNTVTYSNTANYNNYGLCLRTGSSNNIFTDNTFLDNLRFDIYIDATSSGNTGTNNVYDNIEDNGTNNAIEKVPPCAGTDNDLDLYSTAPEDIGEQCCGVGQLQTCLNGSPYVDCDDNATDDPEICIAVTDPALCNETTGACAICINPGATEKCNGVDDDCNDIPDDGIADKVTDIYGKDDIGECKVQIESCISGGWQIIQNAVGPSTELCDGLDNDCDTLVDDGLIAPAADKTAGVCAGSVKVCKGTLGWQEPDYTLITGYEATEATCDGLDNDCNGLIDDHDQTPPTTYDNAPTEWVNYDVDVTLTATDNICGVQATYYCLDTALCTPNTEGTTISIIGEGTHYLSYLSIDESGFGDGGIYSTYGNVEPTTSKEVKIDKTEPTATIEITSANDEACSFWFQWWIDDGNVQRDVVHGCARIRAVIDASISGLDRYTLEVSDGTNVVVQPTEGDIVFNFDTAEDVYIITLKAWDNAGNYVTVSRTIFEDDDNDVAILQGEGGAPDFFDLCPAQVPSIDLDKDGCQDIEGVSLESATWCIDVYSGRAVSSLNPTTSLTTVGTSFMKGKKTWYNMNSDIDAGVQTAYAMNVVDKQGKYKDEIHCKIDADTLKTSSGIQLSYTKKDAAKLVYKDIKGVMKVKEKYHTHELGDGSKIHANMKYDENKDESKLHLTYQNKDKEKECKDAAKAAKEICEAACGKDKNCKKACHDTEKAAKDECRDNYHYQIKQEYTGYKTLSLYDIMKLVGYE